MGMLLPPWHSQSRFFPSSIASSSSARALRLRLRCVSEAAAGELTARERRRLRQHRRESHTASESDSESESDSDGGAVRHRASNWREQVEERLLVEAKVGTYLPSYSAYPLPFNSNFNQSTSTLSNSQLNCPNINRSIRKKSSSAGPRSSASMASLSLDPNGGPSGSQQSVLLKSLHFSPALFPLPSLSSNSRCLIYPMHLCMFHGLPLVLHSNFNQIYNPSIRHRRKSKDGVILIKQKPLVPGTMYLHCILDRQVHDFVKNCQGVGGFVGSQIEAR